ncbi:MAG: DUF3883 domain-containing protein [Gemmatimonadales bacterium]
MNHWIQYHNSAELGFPERPKGAFGIFWYKPVQPPVGSRIWLVASRRAKPRFLYYLVETFVAAEVEEGHASGTKGEWYGDSVRIDTEPWFDAFRTYMGHFGRGLSPLRPGDVKNFREAIARAAPAVVKLRGAPTTASGFGEPEENQLVERAAIEAAKKHLKKQGWQVRSVEAQNCGYDLLCQSQRGELHVEVKGLSAEDITSVIITDNELQTAKHDDHWRLLIVTSARSAPVVHEYDGPTLAVKFGWRPITYRLFPRAGRQED